MKTEKKPPCSHRWKPVWVWDNGLWVLVRCWQCGTYQTDEDKKVKFI